jgi:membrane-bound lytic murein transglycosylase B
MRPVLGIGTETPYGAATSENNVAATLGFLGFSTR